MSDESGTTPPDQEPPAEQPEGAPEAPSLPVEAQPTEVLPQQPAFAEAPAAEMPAPDAQPTQVLPAQPAPSPAPAAQPLPASLQGPTVASGSRVVVVISRGPSPQPPVAFVNVPDVIGLSQGDALARLQELGLSAQVFNDYSSTVPRGEVMGQLPHFGGSVPTAAETVLLVSSGPAAAESAAVPLLNVIGLGEAEAISKLQAGGLSPQIVREYNPNIPDGVVIDQLPSSATLAEMPQKKSSLAWLWVTLAILAVLAVGVGGYLWYNRTGTVPNVVQLSQADAEAAITAAGFKVGALGTTQTISAAEVGKVVTQTPSPAGQARIGSSISIVVSGGQKLFEIPDVTNQAQGQAETALKSAGFTTTVAQAYSTSVAKGNVISQAPPAGTQVPSGTAIQITVSQGPQNVNVPSLVGQSQSTAQSALKTNGLGSQIVTNYNELTPKGQVYAQYPAAGTSIAPGTIVAMAVSNGPLSSSSTTETIPNVVGKTQSQAQTSLSNNGLKSVVVSWSGTGQAQGLVVGQTPDSGLLVPKNTSVIIIVSNGK